MEMEIDESSNDCHSQNDDLNAGSSMSHHQGSSKINVDETSSRDADLSVNNSQIEPSKKRNSKLQRGYKSDSKATAEQKERLLAYRQRRELRRPSEQLSNNSNGVNDKQSSSIEECPAPSLKHQKFDTSSFLKRPTALSDISNNSDNVISSIAPQKKEKTQHNGRRRRRKSSKRKKKKASNSSPSSLSFEQPSIPPRIENDEKSVVEAAASDPMDVGTSMDVSAQLDVDTSMDVSAQQDARPARQAVLVRVEHKKRTKRLLYDDEKLKRSEDYAKKHPEGYTLSQEEIDKLVPPAAKHKIPSTITPCSTTAAELHSEATTLLNAGNHDEAIEKYHSALQHTPEKDIQSVCSLQFKLAQCLLSHHSTDIVKLDEGLQALDSSMRHLSGDEKSAAIRLAVSIHEKIIEQEDVTTAEGLNTVISSIFVQRRYIKELGSDEELDRIMKSNSKY